MMVRTGAQHICLEPMARDMVELLPGAEWKGRQRLTLPPAPVLHELHPMLHAPQAPPPSVLSEVRGIVVDVLSVAADWTDFVAAELERMLGGSRLQEGHESHMDGPVDWNALALQWRRHNLEDATVWAAEKEAGAGQAQKARRRGLQKIVEYLKPAMSVGQEPLEPELDHLNRVWLRLPPWTDAVQGLGSLRASYLLAGVDEATSLWDLASLGKHSGMAAAAVRNRSSSCRCFSLN